MLIKNVFFAGKKTRLINSNLLLAPKELVLARLVPIELHVRCSNETRNTLEENLNRGFLKPKERLDELEKHDYKRNL